VNVEGNEITVARPNDEKENRSLHGTSRSLIANMVEGVSKGFQKELEIIGVGYCAQMQGNKLVIKVGYSHPVEIEVEEYMKIEVLKNTKIILKDIDKERVGKIAANILTNR